MIVAGYTGSSPSTPALEFAAKLSKSIPSPLRIVHAFDLPTMDVPMGPGIDPPSQNEVEQWCSEVTTEAEELARTFGAEDVSTQVYVGTAPAALIENAGPDDLIVVGHRGRGELASALLGSVAIQVSAHAPCPVLVITKGASTAAVGPIVVGVDGSQQSRKAVQFAASWADHLGRSLTMVAAWQPQTMVGMAGGWALPMMSDAGDQIEQATLSMLQDIADEVAEAHPSLSITCQAVSGDPAEALVRAGEGATAVIVGSRGRGGFTGLLLGSVSHRVIHSAPVPVGIVR
ncbi:MAG TPA: universal stress protein [Candidatus Avipropionibacterium avicola]|uniref:Universal stress protein n=1 Tax=Candidatus Avipropionibacterium avicola TaxID=2840701 RepID=A0A9D1H040_9ACTN|nr:universal stress protein [Candidatus Avipropionibacterium avicola]